MLVDHSPGNHEAYLQVYLPIYHQAGPDLLLQVIANLFHLCGLHGVTGACLAHHDSGTEHQVCSEGWDWGAQCKRASRVLGVEGLNLLEEKLLQHYFV
jgi:hypothetical protein